MLNLVFDKFKTPIILVLLTSISLFSGYYYGISHQKMIVENQIAQIKQEEKVRENVYNKSLIDMRESFNLQSQKLLKKIKNDQKIINSTNHINDHFVQYVSGTHVSEQASSYAKTNEPIPYIESVPAARVAEYIVELKNHDDQCVGNYNLVMRYSFPEEFK